MHEPDWEWDQLPDIYTRGPVFSDTVGRPTPRPEMSDRVRKGSRDINMDFRGPNIARIPQVTATSPGRKGMLPIGHEPSWSQKFDDNVRAQIAQEALEDAREREWRQRQGMLGKAAMDRLIDLLKGGEPTRESTEEWMLRQQRRGMLPGIDGRIIPQAAPRPKTPANGGTRG
jgi:hypothetical protein